MKKLIIVTLLLIMSVCTHAQLTGSFSYGQDGHIYFTLTNPTAYQIPVTWGVSNFQTGEKRVNQGAMAPYSNFVYGPNAGWIWMKDEIFMVTYSNGQSQHWTCPQNDPSVGKSNNPSFKGKHCRGTVGCACSGFEPITSGDLWQREYCRKCSHKKSYHK